MSSALTRRSSAAAVKLCRVCSYLVRPRSCPRRPGILQGLRTACRNFARNSVLADLNSRAIHLRPCQNLNLQIVVLHRHQTHSDRTSPTDLHLTESKPHCLCRHPHLRCLTLIQSRSCKGTRNHDNCSPARLLPDERQIIMHRSAHFNIRPMAMFRHINRMRMDIRPQEYLPMARVTTRGQWCSKRR